MKNVFMLVFLSACVAIASMSSAQVPAGATGLCKDGTAWTGATKSGACSGHKGVKEWYGSSAAPTSTPTSMHPAAPAPAPMPSTKAPAVAAPMAAAAGGGNGQVWVNRSSKVYHCATDKWYGKTKDGEYMSEQAAKSQGYHPDHGKACQ